MQSIEIYGLKAVQRKLEEFPYVMRQARGEFFDAVGNELLSAVQRRIGGTGRVAGVQEYYVGTGEGYAAVRAKAKTELDGYAAGYLTNALENGHEQQAGRYVPAIGKRLKETRVRGKNMYHDTIWDAVQIAERGAREIEERAMAHLEGTG